MQIRQEHGAHKDLARLLYVDDEGKALKYFERIFADSACVMTCLSPQEALGFLGKTTTEFDAVIADQRMPHMTGDALLRSVASRWPHIARILTTAYHENDLLEQLSRSGTVDGVIMKPWSAEALKAEILDTIDATKRLRSPTTSINPNPDAAAIRFMTIGLGASHDAHCHIADAVAARSFLVLRSFVENQSAAGACKLRESLSWALNHLPETKIFYFNSDPGPQIAVPAHLAGALVSELIREVHRIALLAENAFFDISALERETSVELHVNSQAPSRSANENSIDVAAALSVPQLLVHPSIMFVGLVAQQIGGKLTLSHHSTDGFSAVLELPLVRQTV